MLDDVVAGLAGGGEPRPGQRTMAAAVADTIAASGHLVVQAGTGTGKSLAYLVPAIASGKRVVVATATKALQDQLADKDLPYLADRLEHRLDEPLTYAVLKGRSNYLCRQRLAESTATESLDLDELNAITRDQVRRLALWSVSSVTGDRAELDWEPSDKAWGAVSVSGQECPGANQCPMGGTCFAEQARRNAAEAQVIVVNLHLYGLHLAADQMLLPEHDVVVIDEAHQLEDVISATSGLELTGGRFVALSRMVRSVLEAEQLVATIVSDGSHLAEVLGRHRDGALPRPIPPELAGALASAGGHLAQVTTALNAITSELSDVQQRKLRALKATVSLAEDVNAIAAEPPASVMWVEGAATNPRLRVAPIDVAPVLTEGIWDQRPAILTSATIPVGFAERVGLTSGEFTTLDVGSPFDYATNSLLYCAIDLPEPRSTQFAPAMHDELASLIEAAGGRTLALFTSWRALEEAVSALRPRIDARLFVQGDAPTSRLVEQFTADETSCLFATASFFQGIDVPGRALSLVTIDKLPFPRPDEPLLQARRDLAGPDAFRTIDLPRAAMLLAQAAGRLIRTANDRGVVAVFDRRLGKANYRWDLIGALPPMRRTRHRSEVEEFLRSL